MKNSFAMLTNFGTGLARPLEPRERLENSSRFAKAQRALRAKLSHNETRVAHPVPIPTLQVYIY